MKYIQNDIAPFDIDIFSLNFSDKHVPTCESDRAWTYLCTDLESATDYTFHVYDCNGYTLECGEPSKAVKGTTSDSKSRPPSIVVKQCNFDKVHVADIFEFALCDLIRRCPLLPSSVGLSQISKAPHIPMNTQNRRYHETGI